MYFSKKDAGLSDLLNATSLGLSFAYNLPVWKDQYLSFGIQASYHNKQTSLENLTTGSQWLANEFRFDPNADLGESFTQNRINYVGFNSGVTWYLEDKKHGWNKAFASVAAFNLNKPNDSFFEDQSSIPIGFLARTGALLYHTKRFHLTPQIFYQYENTNSSVNLLLSGKFLFDNNNPYDIIQTGSLELIARSNFSNEASIGIVLQQPGFSAGFSYHFPVAGETVNNFFQSGIEVGITLSRTVWRAKPTKIVIESTNIAPKRSFEFNQSTTPQGNTSSPAVTPSQPSDVDLIQKKIEDLAKVKSVEFELEKDFKFTFGRAELNQEAKVYLDELYVLLKNNPEYQLEIIGHTDNVGKHLANYHLSTARAQAVAQYLKQIGLAPDRVKYIGRGDTEPVAPNDTEENKAKNRRVEFIIFINR
ncbi:MAG: type IX secretion system membrane protein PorP/SprF [Cytophagia bacterium]|nr:type IX secretion system membrane protein PorP/SprF [Cytophagia bacterium]